jgi:hypothetical protein
MRSVRWGLIGAGAAMLIGSGLSAPAQAGYTVTLEQQGADVVATGSGAIDLAALSFSFSASGAIAAINPSFGFIRTGPASGEVIDTYTGVTGPGSFGSGGTISASSGSGGIVGIDSFNVDLEVPQGYVSGNSLSDTATYLNQTFSSLGATPGTYEWTWGSGATADSFTLQIGLTATVPAPVIGHGLPVLLAVGSLLFGAKLLERGKRRRLQFG